MQTNTPPKPQRASTWWLDLTFLTVVIGCLFFVLLGDRPLFVPDEGRYAEIAREMVASHNWITPTLNGIEYFEKPILFYWLGAIAIKIGGVTIGSVRSINAIIGLLGCLMTYGVARHCYDRRTGLLAAGILATSLLYFVMSHMVSLDLPVTVFNSATLFSFLLAFEASTARATRAWLYSAATAAALAVLTKGLIGLAFPGLIVLTFVTLTRGWSRLWQLPLFSALLVFFVIATPWHVLVNREHPEFFYFYFIEQQFLRYTSKDIGHYQPVWFFIPTLLAGFFPWVVFLPQTLKTIAASCWRAPKANRANTFFLIWVVLIFVFFSFSKSKLIPYILPIFPALAILTAHVIADTLTSTQHKTLHLSLWVLAALALALLIAIKHVLPQAALAHSLAAEHTLSMACIYLLIGCLSTLFLIDFKPNLALGALVISSAAFSFVAFSAFKDLDTRTVQPLANTLIPILKPENDVITYNQYYQDLPFYLQRRVSILNWRNEMSYGMAHQDTRAWMINDETFWKRWHGKERVFVFISNDELARLKSKMPSLSVSILGETLTTSLISNRPN